MAEKLNKNMVIGIAVAVVVVIAIIVGIVIAKGNDGGIGEGDDGTGQIEEGMNEMDFSDIDVSVGFGDYDVMEAQSKAIQNGEMIGRVIKIEGYVSHPMSKYSIGEKDENGSFIGTEFIIEGVSENDYPQDGDHVVLTGEVIEKEPLYYVIRTAPQYVEILESFEDVDDEIDYGDESDAIEIVEGSADDFEYDELDEFDEE